MNWVFVSEKIHDKYDGSQVFDHRWLHERRPPTVADRRASLAADLYTGMLDHCGPAGTECDVIFPADPGASLPVGTAIRDYDGIAWTGCSSCVFSGEPDVALQIEFARECFRQGVPAFGSCWAAQIAVVAAGGQVALNPKGREMGIARGPSR
ncbi:MAG: hypothetical protein Ct9H300mP32_2220 [Verrucomicrobiota bacterium]|nr:MAG: hypothetical protein Ct9H300mP32_2220 [Verrucomicrobiota bacterium]